MAYSDKVVEHYQNPRNVGSFGTSKDVAGRRDVGVGIVGAPECGDVMQLQIRVNEQGVIEDAKFKCFGCGSAIASSSLATEWLKGKSIDDALEIKNTQIVEELSLPPVKIHCSVLAEDSIRAAIADYRKKNAINTLISSLVTGGSSPVRTRSNRNTASPDDDSSSTTGWAMRDSTFIGPATRLAMRSGATRPRRFGTSSPITTEK